MQDSEILKYGRYLTSLAASAILNTAPPAPFENIDWVKLFNLARKHDIAVTIYPVIKNMALPEEAMLLYTKERNRMVARTARQNIEAERVLAELEKNSIKYIKLKGSHIKNYYPADCVRTFGDVDLCLTADGREKAKSIMADLGYTLEKDVDYHDEYEKDKFHIFELHSNIISYTYPYADLFEEPFSKSVPSTDNNLGYVLKTEYLYLHLFFHLFKHFNSSGCGVRFFVDFLVFENYVQNVDYNYIFSVLKKYKMQDFYKTFVRLKDYFFSSKKADKDTEQIALYIFKSNTTGISERNMANYSFWEKFRYFLRIWFPPVSELDKRYPVLKKAPVLLPACWVSRAFHSLFFKREFLKTHINEVKTVNSSEFKKIKKTRKLASKEK